MKALSIRQPWAWLIVNGYKDIENRSWGTSFRGRVYIHAGLKQDYEAYDGEPAHRYLEPYIWTKLSWDAITDWGQVSISHYLGVIVGEVDIVDCLGVDEVNCSTEKVSQWFEDPYGFVLANPVAYDEPIPCKGRLGFFEPNIPTRSSANHA